MQININQITTPVYQPIILYHIPSGGRGVASSNLVTPTKTNTLIINEKSKVIRVFYFIIIDSSYIIFVVF
jgi:hypothetical protein